MLHHLQALALAAEDGGVRHAHVGEPDVRVVGGHVERPQELEHLEARALGRHEERGDAVAVAGLAAGAGHDHVVLRLVDAGVPRLLAVDDPLVAVAHRRGLHVRGVAAVVRLGDAEREAATCPRRERRSTRPSARRCRRRSSAAGRRCCRRWSARSAGRCAGRGPCGRGARG